MHEKRTVVETVLNSPLGIIGIVRKTNHHRRRANRIRDGIAEKLRRSVQLFC